MELRLLRYFVAVAEERHIGRAASRLRMTQPPLSRAIRKLEREFGVALMTRTPKGVELTAAGTALYREARPLLDRSERLVARVGAAGQSPTITVGTCADTADQLGGRLVHEFRRRHPHVALVLHETDLTDPTAGLRADIVDVALTRAPFEMTDLTTHVLRTDPVGVVMLDTDPLAHLERVALAELTDRRWIRLPQGTDPAWSSYWHGDAVSSSIGDRPVIRTIQESLQSVLWSGATTFAPIGQAVPEGLVNVPVIDKDPSRIVVACKRVQGSPVIRSFLEVAVSSSRLEHPGDT